MQQQPARDNGQYCQLSQKFFNCYISDILKVDFLRGQNLTLKKLRKKMHIKYLKSHIKGAKTCKNGKNA